LCAAQSGDGVEASEREFHGGGGGGRARSPVAHREEHDEEPQSGRLVFNTELCHFLYSIFPDDDQWQSENTEQYKKHFKKGTLLTLPLMHFLIILSSSRFTMPVQMWKQSSDCKPQLHQM
jgi:hypothetical protein